MESMFSVVVLFVLFGLMRLVMVVLGILKLRLLMVCILLNIMVRLLVVSVWCVCIGSVIFFVFFCKVVVGMVFIGLCRCVVSLFSRLVMLLGVIYSISSSKVLKNSS